MKKKKITENFIAVDKVIMYSFNYDYNFIENAFNGYMADHLRIKFSNYCKRLGNSQTAFMYLYTDLSSDNRQTLINYILTNKN
jgi:hypothetical protein